MSLLSRLSTPNPLEAGGTRRGFTRNFGSFPSAFPRPAADDAQRGSIVLGERKGGFRVAVPLGRLAQSLVVTGAPGMRKTTAVANIIRQLAAYGSSVIILEPAKTEYASVLAGIPTAVYGDGTRGYGCSLRVNPFAVPDGVRLATWESGVSDAIADAYAAADEPAGRMYLDDFVGYLYRCKGLDGKAAHSGTAFPNIRTFRDLVDRYVEAEVHSGREVSANVRGFLKIRARRLQSCEPLITDVGMQAGDLFGQGISIFELAGYGSANARFLAMILLLQIIESAKTSGARPLHTVVVVEEAHALFRDAVNGEETMFAREYESALAELRASGVGFVTIDQRASLLPTGVLASSCSKLHFACTQADDRKAVQGDLGLDDEQARHLGELQAGSALFTTEGTGTEKVETGKRC